MLILIIAVSLLLLIIIKIFISKIFLKDKKIPKEEISAILACLSVIIEDKSNINIIIKNNKMLWQSNEMCLNGVYMRKFNVFVNDNCYTVEVQEIHDQTTEQKKVCKFPPTASERTIIAPIDGVIVDVKVSIGQKVSKGDVLFIIEAMKMNNEIKAMEDLEVSCLYISKDDTVDVGQVLLTY